MANQRPSIQAGRGQVERTGDSERLAGAVEAAEDVLGAVLACRAWSGWARVEIIAYRGRLRKRNLKYVKALAATVAA